MTRELAKNLTRLRRERGFSQEQLAERLAVSRQAVGKWEAGHTLPELEKLVMLADLFGVTLDELVRGEKGVQRGASFAVSAGNAAGEAAGRGPAGPDAAGLQGGSVGGAGTAMLFVPGYEYKSKRCWHGLPLVHINFGYTRYGFGLRRAKGVIAIGNIATGIVALGGFSLGLVSLGGISMGLLALGGVAIGGLALAGCAMGIVAIGASAIGIYSLGAAAVAAQAAVGTSAVCRNASAGTNPDADFLITAFTTEDQLAAYLRARCPEMPRLLVWLFSLVGR